MQVLNPTTIGGSEGTITRSTTATYINSSGNVATASINTLRSTYDAAGTVQGVLLEPSATNLLTYSEQFDNAIWTKTGTSVSANTTTSPDTTTTGDTITGLGTIDNGVFYTTGTSAASAGLYVYSVWLQGTGTVSIGLGTSTGVGESAEKLVTLTTAWVRHSIACTYTEASTGNIKVLGCITRDGSAPTLHMWGAQLELISSTLTSEPTSYIPTTTATVTRAADVITSSSASVVYSNLAETDYTAWNAATSYSIGTKVVRSTSTVHKIYENLIAGVDAGLPEVTPSRWLEVSATNRYAMLDLYRSTKSNASSGVIRMCITPKARCDSIAFLGLAGASSITLNVYAANNDILYRKTFNLSQRTPTGWYSYFFSPITYRSSLIVVDIPPSIGATFCIEINGTSAQIGSMLLGLRQDLGTTQTGASIDALNFSTITRDAFGNVSLTPRRSVPKTRQTVFAPVSMLTSLANMRDSLNATPALWLGNSDYNSDFFEAFAIFGIYKTFSIAVSNNIAVIVTLELEEL